jgi:replicative DNA helicase
MKQLPHNLEAERNILGGLLLDSESWDCIDDILSGTDFFDKRNQLIFETIKELQSKGLPVDLVTVTDRLNQNGSLTDVGGAEYLYDLIESTLSSANIETYAQLVKEKSIVRNLIRSSTDIIEKAYSGQFESVEHLLDSAEEKIYQINNQRNVRGLRNPMDVVRESIAKIEELYNKGSDVTGLGSGFKGLDNMTTGFHAGELIIVAARPSMGKTAFSLNLAEDMAINQKKIVAYFSLEMSEDALMMRLLSSRAGIDLKSIRTGKVYGEHWSKLIQAASDLSESGLFIDASSGLSPFDIRARCRRLKATKGLDCIIIDYLQQIRLKDRVENREKEVSEISRLLKVLSKELQVPVIALAQLNRSVEGRAEKKPMLSDLRESGAIEQDADLIMMLYREDYYDKENPQLRGRAEVIIAKQRNGATGPIKLQFEAEVGRFRDASPNPPPSYGANPAAFASPIKPKNFAPSSSPGT